MDDVNRKITLRTLYEEAKTMAGRRQVRRLLSQCRPPHGLRLAFWAASCAAAAEADCVVGLCSTAC